MQDCMYKIGLWFEKWMMLPILGKFKYPHAVMNQYLTYYLKGKFPSEKFMLISAIFHQL